MITDSRRFRPDAELKCDLCIIGAGALLSRRGHAAASIASAIFSAVIKVGKLVSA